MQDDRSVPIMTGDEIAEENRRRLDRQIEVGRTADRLIGLRKQLGRRYENCHFDNYHISKEAAVAKLQNDRLQKLRSFAADLVQRCKDGTGLGLIGTVGTGKDHLMTAAMFVAIADGLSVEFRDGATLYREFHSVIDGKTTDSEIIDPLLKCDILAISDPLPPEGSVKEFIRSKLFSIVDARYRDMKPIWWTANVRTRPECDARLSPQITDRLIDGSLILEFDWPSHRQKLAWTGADNVR